MIATIRIVLEFSMARSLDPGAASVKLLLARPLPHGFRMKPPRWLTVAGGALGALALYATLVEPRWLQVRRRRVHIRSLPTSLEGLRVALLTDLHLTGHRAGGTLRRAVDAVLREGPDVVAVTGDLAEDRPGLEAALDELIRLDAPLGVYVIPGNHDHRAGIGQWREAVAARKAVADLTNRYVLLPVGGATLCMAGVDDHLEGRPLLRLPPPDLRDTTILLAHSPDLAEQARRSHDAVDLIVSGHTHGGQVRFPFMRAPVNSATHPELYEDGLRRRPWTQVYTSRGIGTTRLPVRFLARPEVAILQLTRDPRPPRRTAIASLLVSRAGRRHIPQPVPAGDGQHSNRRGAYENP
jgi:uncharacterized protein